MRFATRVGRVIITLSLLFLLLTSIIVSVQLQNVRESHNLIEDVEPVLQAIQHLLITVYEDHIVLEEYLATASYSAATELDATFEESSALCEELADDIGISIAKGSIADETIISSYQMGMLSYNSLQNARNKLTELHKEEIATQQYSTKKAEYRENYDALFAGAVAAFTTSSTQMHTYVVETQAELAQKQQFLTQLLIVLLITLCIFSVIAWRSLVRQIALPIQEFQEKIAAFSAGESNVRITADSPVVEIEQLKHLLNNVFRVVKRPVQQKLLPARYADVLAYVKLQAEQGKVPTIKDVKKELGITHPTAKERISYLEKHGFIRVEQQGRNKCLVPM